jgi:hypothetical protein
VRHSNSAVVVGRWRIWKRSNVAVHGARLSRSVALRSGLTAVRGTQPSVSRVSAMRALAGRAVAAPAARAGRIEPAFLSPAPSARVLPSDGQAGRQAACSLLHRHQRRPVVLAWRWQALCARSPRPKGLLACERGARRLAMPVSSRDAFRSARGHPGRVPVRAVIPRSVTQGAESGGQRAWPVENILRAGLAAQESGSRPSRFSAYRRSNPRAWPAHRAACATQPLELAMLAAQPGRSSLDGSLRRRRAGPGRVSPGAARR